jgi:hypothetical protein
MKQGSRKRQSQRRQQQHHVFVFRHCVRSTPSIVDMKPFPHAVNSTTENDNMEQDQYQRNASDFTASPLPLWNTPDVWCTQEGMSIMKETGKFLWNDKIHTSMIPTDSNNADGSEKERVMRIQFQLITDTSQRDVDTSFALAEGLSEAATESVEESSSVSIVIDGLDDLVYDPVLFSPLEPNTHWQSSSRTSTSSASTPASVPLCETLFTQEQLNHDIDLRLQKVPPPEPGLVATLQLLRDLGGVGPMGPPSKEEVEVEDGYEQGDVSLVKLFAQMMFYSRVSGIQPPFLPNATLNEVYQLVDWVHWSRSVLHIDNVQSVTEGAVLAHAVLEALETGQYHNGERSAPQLDPLDGGASQEDIDDDEDDYDIRITIIVGHDGNQNTLASALGVRWQLPAPFQSRLEDAATPPGSALHFSHDTVTGSLEMSFLYPVFNIDWTLNETSGLGSVPLVFMDASSDTFSNAMKNRNDAGRATEIGASDDGRSGVELLRERLFSVLRVHPGAMECYDAAVSRTVSSLPMTHVDYSNSNSNTINWLIAGTLLGNAFIVLCCWITRRKTQRQKKNITGQTASKALSYESVSRNLEIT